MPIIGMKKDAEQRWKNRCNYVLAAWASLCVGVVSFASLGLWGLYYGLNHMDGINRGGMGDELVGAAVCLVLLLVSAAGGFAGVRSLFGIRSWWNALFIIPGALFGILINGFIVCACIANLLGFSPR